ncbi:predicted protein [Nematostella vectensis]|uniref:Essential protein Yae1 N-terminal domain-containing protein n=2 Tax=Nematostella vectensis TaxID=45351 RepID=A7RQV9_NEMVE|nr:predicted protein [Nematostella vectensis]|eukprot:XP_001638300.1 predicted protein [Nematostella vectensis]
MADELDSDGEAEREVEFRKLKDTHEKTGYVVGKKAGKESSLQSSFNQGFTDISRVGMATGFLRGIISSLLSNIPQEEKTVHTSLMQVKLTQTLEQVNKIEGRFLLNVGRQSNSKVENCVCRTKRNTCQDDLHPDKEKDGNEQCCTRIDSNDSISQKTMSDDVSNLCTEIRNIWLSLIKSILTTNMNISQEDINKISMKFHEITFSQR